MTIRKEPSGKFRAVLKVGREYVAARTFDAKREARAWLARERAAIAGRVDPRAGRATVRSLLPVWLAERRHSVSAKTYVSDAALARLVPHSLVALSVNAVTDREVSRALIALTPAGLAESSVRRFRASLSSFFAWAGDRVLPLVRSMAAGREADAPLFVTSSGHRLHSTAFKRTLGWSTLAEGRRIHDLRHTAACLWLARGVDRAPCRRGWGTRPSRRRTSTCTTSAPPPTAPDWSVSALGGTPGAHERRRGPNDKERTPPDGQRFRWSDGVPVTWS